MPTPGGNQRRGLLGAINLTTGSWHYHAARTCVSVVFCHFLEQLPAAYPCAAVVAVLADNDSAEPLRSTLA